MNINRSQLTFAREYRGYTQTELAAKIQGLSQSNLSKYEKGFDTLSEQLLEKIIYALDFPRGFFLKKILNETETAQYRRRSSISKRDKTSIEQSYKLIGFLIDEMSNSIEWPEFSLTNLDLEKGYTPELVAQHTRKLLGLTPDVPARNICNALELKGIIIVELDAIDKFDGVSLISDNGSPIIIINRKFSSDRKRFTIAHELGHLLMHSIGTPPIPKHRNSKILEDEANQFASEFLMPAKSIKDSLYRLRLKELGELKRYWLTSMASILRRAKDLSCISKESYVYLNIELRRRTSTGKKRDEGIEVFIDNPTVFKKGYCMHKQELAYTTFELASAFCLPVDVLKRYCEPARNSGKLRIVL